MSTSSLILFFQDIAPGQLSLAGGKGLNLGSMARAGFPVPPGFVLTTEAFCRPESEEVRDALLTAYKKLGAGPVAVRSSATAEDLEAASFAGQQETFLNVEGARALLDAVRRCWASLSGERARAYRAAQGIAEDQVAMAVVVQRMVPAEAAGVLFTRDPSQPNGDSMLVEAAWGLGEAVVSGRVTPDRWALDRATGRALKEEIADKPVRVTSRGEEEVPAESRSRPCLSPEALERLAALGRQVEAHYGAPQDIEWALAAGELLLLQSRPITAGGREREQVRREGIEFLRSRAEPGGTVWARYSLAEVLPEPLPYTWALWRQFMSGGGGYGRMYRELGYDPDPSLDTDGILDLIAGRPYFNLSRDARLYFRDFPYDYPFDKLKADPEKAIYPTPEANLARAPKGFVLKMIGVTRQMLAAERTLERAAAEVPERLERESFPTMARFAREMRDADLASLSQPQLLAFVETARRTVFDDYAPQGLKPSVLAGLAIQKLRAELQGAFGEREAHAAADRLLVGAAPVEPYDLAGALRKLSAGTLTLQAFLDQFGHRGPGEMELANPRWREVGQGRGEREEGRGPALARAFPSPLPPLPSPLPLEEVIAGKKCNARQAGLYLERARRFTALREAAKHFLMLGYEVLRLALVELDRRYGLQGGIFYLEPPELDKLTRGEDVRAEIARRRKRRAVALGLEAPRVLFSDDPEAIGRPEPQGAAGEVLEGTGVSAGVAEGEALVLRSPDRAPADARDFVLVCPSTDPGWVPLFVRARGLVLETGGVLSHGAIVAREFGLPAVANVGNACSRLRTGQRLRVDGSEGTVRLLES